MLGYSCESVKALYCVLRKIFSKAVIQIRPHTAFKSSFSAIQHIYTYTVYREKYSALSILYTPFLLKPQSVYIL
jgi:hypothetical protein